MYLVFIIMTAFASFYKYVVCVCISVFTVSILEHAVLFETSTGHSMHGTNSRDLR